MGHEKQTNDHQREIFEIKQMAQNSYMLWFNFILGLNFISLLFGKQVMYDNESRTMENKI